MSGWSLKGLFGGKPAKKKSAQTAASKKPSKTYLSGGENREALIEEAMKVYRERRAEAYGLLDHTLREMRKKPPKTVSEQDQLVRLLELRRATVAMKSLMSHDLKRYLVLPGVRGLLEGDGANRQVSKGSSRQEKRKPARNAVAKR